MKQFLWYSFKATTIPGARVNKYLMADGRHIIGNFVTNSQHNSGTAWDDINCLGKLASPLTIIQYDILYNHRNFSKKLSQEGYNKVKTFFDKHSNNIFSKGVLNKNKKAEEVCNHPPMSRVAERGGKTGCYKCGSKDIDA